MINSDQIHVAMTKMSGRVATLVCQSNIPMKKQDERASCLEKSERLDAVARHPHTACACENEEERSSSIVLVVGVQREGERERERETGMNCILV